MKKLVLLIALTLSSAAFAEVRNEIKITSQDEIRQFILAPHSFLYDAAASSYLVRNSSASDLMDQRLKEYLTDNYHLSRVNTGSSIKGIRVDLSEFNTKDDDSRIFVHFEYTNDKGSERYYHSKYVTFADGRVFYQGLIENGDTKIKDFEACKAYHNGHPLACD